MRYLTFSLPNERTPRVGVLDRDRVVELPEFPNMLALIAAGGIRAIPYGPAYASGDIRWHAAIPRPGQNVFCLGRNSAEHGREAAGAPAPEVQLPRPP